MTSTLPTNPDIHDLRLEWIQDLLTTTTPQTRGELYSNMGGMCCLGRLCDISGQGTWENNGPSQGRTYFISLNDEHVNCMPPGIIKYLNFRNDASSGTIEPWWLDTPYPYDDQPNNDQLFSPREDRHYGYRYVAHPHGHTKYHIDTFVEEPEMPMLSEQPCMIAATHSVELASLNDDGWSFKQIAQVLLDHYEWFFNMPGIDYDMDLETLQ